MTICLLVYAALQHRIRQSLQQQQQSFPDQKGKPSQKPTTRWVFQCFVGIHLLAIPWHAKNLFLISRTTTSSYSLYLDGDMKLFIPEKVVGRAECRI